jgi:hypothetical protein
MLTPGAEAALPLIAAIMKPEFAKCRVEVTIEGIARSLSLPRLTRDRHGALTVHLGAVTLEPALIVRPFDTRAGNHTITAPLLAGSTDLDEKYEHVHECEIRFETTWFDRL